MTMGWRWRHMSENGVTNSYLVQKAGKAAIEARDSQLREILCGRCENGTVFRRRGLSTPLVYCSMLRREMPHDVVECTAYAGRDDMDLTEMNKIATVIDARSGVHSKSCM